MPTDKRRELTYTTTLPAPPDRVFPLLCPVREHDWIDGWRCRLLHAVSGVAELDCVFRTDLDGDSLWTVSRYEPPHRIEFVITTDGALLSRLEITLTAEDGGRTAITWRRVYTAVGPGGESRLESVTEEAWHRVYTAVGPGGESRLESVTEEAFESRMRSLNQMLRHYLKSDHLHARVGVMNRDTWVSLLAASGFSHDDMRRWHAEFERLAPDRHREFLEFLCIPADDIERIRAWALAEDD